MTTLYKGAIVGLVTAVSGLLVQFIVIQFVLNENVDVALLFKLRGSRQPPHDVAIVSMDRYSADKLHLPYDTRKWPRSIHARLIENMNNAGAEVVAFDIMFRYSNTSEEDNLFAHAIESAGNVVLCESLKKETSHLTDETGTHIGYLNIEKLEQPVQPIAQSAFALAPFPVPRVPTRVNHFWVFKTSAGDIPTLPVVVFQVYALDVYDEFKKFLEIHNPSGIDKLPSCRDEIINTKSVVKVIQILKEIFEKNTLLAENMQETLYNRRPPSIDQKEALIFNSLIHLYKSSKSGYLNFYGPSRTITTIPYYDALQFQDPVRTQRELIDLKGKAVFVGSSQSLNLQKKDGFSTIFSQSGKLETSGVEIAATAFANLLDNISVRNLKGQAYFVIIFAWGMILCILCGLLSPLVSTMSIACLCVLYLLIAIYQFKTNYIWYPIVIPLFYQAPIACLGSIGLRYCNKNRERWNIRSRLKYYLPNRTLDQLSKKIIEIKAHNFLIFGTCLYINTERCYALSKDLLSKNLKGFLKEYSKLISLELKKYSEAVTYMMEDCIQVMWLESNFGTIIRKQACLAALGVNNLMHQSDQPVPLLSGIGLHSGQLSGNIADTFGYYELQSAEDLYCTAAIIERLNKQMGTRILLSKDVVNQLDCFLTREIGIFLLEGKQEPVTVYELLCLKNNAGRNKMRLCFTFSEALEEFKRQSWDDAYQKFDEIIKRYGEDGPSLFYRGLSKQYRNNSFEESWNGLICMDKKSWTDI